MNTQTITLSWTAQQRQNEKRRTDPICKKARAEYYKLWYETHGRGRSQKAKEQNKLWALRNPKANKARQTVSRALKTGRLHKPSRCVNCNERRALLAHHEDYDYPYMVTWICFSCHPRKRDN